MPLYKNGPIYFIGKVNRRISKLCETRPLAHLDPQPLGFYEDSLIVPMQANKHPENNKIATDYGLNH